MKIALIALSALAIVACASLVGFYGSIWFHNRHRFNRFEFYKTFFSSGWDFYDIGAAVFYGAIFAIVSVAFLIGILVAWLVMRG